MVIIVFLDTTTTGSIRFKQELDVKYNGGLSKAILILEKIKVKYDTISWADLIQMAGALAVELSGGPVIDMVYGRKDCEEGQGYEIKVSYKICFLKHITTLLLLLLPLPLPLP